MKIENVSKIEEYDSYNNNMKETNPLTKYHTS